MRVDAVPGIEVEDGGRGLHAAMAARLGLTGMRERMAASGGELRVTDGEGEGGFGAAGACRPRAAPPQDRHRSGARKLL